MAERKPGEYGYQDTSFQTMGGEEGVRRLVDAFYDRMQALPEAREVLEMHSSDLTLSRDKLAAFLCGWLGGPKRYRERWGPIRIPSAHARFPIAPRHRDQWLLCMDGAIESMDVPSDFVEYFKREIRVPANRVVTREDCP